MVAKMVLKGPGRAAQPLQIGNYNFEQVEKFILTFWKNNKIYERIKERNKNGKKFYFLQGPPYTSGRLHIGHAWNHCLKDLALRYKRMRGYNVWDRAGYDMHGLPTEHKVQEKLGLATKEQIEAFGLETFAEECMNWSVEMARLMDTDLQRFAVWLDYTDPYYPVSNDFIEGEWWLIKKAYEKKRLYKGKRALSWCPSCGTAVAKHEQEYQKIQDPSIYVKFKIKENKNKSAAKGSKGTKKQNPNNDYLIIWTTTPWTLAFNLAVMVNPDLTYVKIKVFEERWIVAKELANQVSQIATNHDAEIIEEFKGTKLERLEYIHPWEEEIKFKELKKKHPKIHTVVLSKEYVETSAGTGLVHCAPGCGPEDFEVGHRNNLPAFNNIDQYGVFPNEMGSFKGIVAKRDDKLFVQKLKEKGALIHVGKLSHDYAYCERCKTPVIFRATEQWFFKVEDLIEKMIAANKAVNWVPASGSEAFEIWIKNLRDNSITKQRFWGTPVPLWECETCKNVTVIGSRAELEELGVVVPENLHKPWIDTVTLSCSCGGTKKRIPDILDVWIDSATTSWNSLYYPQREDLLKKFFPADFILEASEQVRLWFYMLLLGSMLGFEKHCYENVYMTGMLYGVDGVKMSKSIGNIISPYEIVDKYGADTLRAYLCSINAGMNISFSWNEIKLKHKNLTVLWNIHKYLIETAQSAQVNPRVLGTLEQDLLDSEERHLISKSQSTLKRVTKLLDKYQLDQIPSLTEELYLELSRTYLQLARDKLSSDGEERSVSLYCVYTVLLDILKMYSLICPFITEAMYQNLKEAFGLKELSLHHYPWPEHDESKINLDLEEHMEQVSIIVQAGLACRERAHISRRWPLQELIIETTNSELCTAIEQLKGALKTMINVKEVEIVAQLPSVHKQIKPNFEAIKTSFGTGAAQIIPSLQKKKPAALNELYEQIEIKGSMPFVVGEDIVDLKVAHFLIEREIPKNFVGEACKGAMVYLNTTVNEELESEGYVRELTRRVQMLRKQGGLRKEERVSLFIRVPEEFYEGIREYEQEILEKTGSTQLILETENEKLPALEQSEACEIKGYSFTVGFTKELVQKKKGYQKKI